MTKQDLNNIALTDEELEAASGGAGQWVAPSRGQWWVWKESQSSATGNPADLHATSSSSTGTSAQVWLVKSSTATTITATKAVIMLTSFLIVSAMVSITVVEIMVS